jgi:hypothetical protein
MEQGGEPVAVENAEPGKEKPRRRRKKKHSKRPSKAKRSRAKKRKRPSATSSSDSGTESSSSSSSSDSEDDTARDLRKLRKQVSALAESQSAVQETLKELSSNYGGLRSELVAVNSRLEENDAAVEGTVATAVSTAVSAAESRQDAARVALAERMTSELQAAIADFQATLARGASQPPATPASLRIALSESPSILSASPTSRHSR